MIAKTVAEQIFLSGVESVLPDKLIQSQVKLMAGVLHISGNKFPLSDFENIYVIAAGKASALMAKEIELILGEYITDGEVVVKYSHGCELQKLRLTQAGHPVPDQNGVEVTNRIIEIALKATERDLVICLISGGASSLMADYPKGATLENLINLNELLVKCGADIKEINTVRKHFSNVKGGQLAKAIYPATTICLILSDVIGDPIDIIASGPTCGDNSYFTDAIAVIEKYKLIDKLLPEITNYIRSGVDSLVPETPKPDNDIFSKVHNIIIGNNKIALKAAQRKAIEYGFSSYIITDSLHGDFTMVAKQILDAINYYQINFNELKPICLFFGGEPTVNVTGAGIGGRNQHLAMYLAIHLKSNNGITILCAGTDGTDGPTEVAGAVVDCWTYELALSKGIDAERHLRDSDSYHFFKKLDGHIITGSTQTNVMDLIVVLIE